MRLFLRLSALNLQSHHYEYLPALRCFTLRNMIPLASIASSLAQIDLTEGGIESSDFM